MRVNLKYNVNENLKSSIIKELLKMELHSATNELGYIEIDERVSTTQLSRINKKFLNINDLSIILKQYDDYDIVLIDKNLILVNNIKSIILDMIYNKEDIKFNFSVFLSKKLNMDYNYLSNLFSQSQLITIGHFIILNKVEMIKELIICDEHSITEISCIMKYSSVAHMCNQFKKVTGLTTSNFRKISKI